ncbi:MAG: response regulator [Magnetococcales bacterium]|nr:response regulator [Magnetococcales bacterium]MBF0151381.1 response regulator [Magnetococcales bacterium]MBF0174347.1 response regulator [Magnetococcales bacterium]MBF0348322.1 response regulator [Magnetococcales bacterium]MBF0631557.1 response regulator [Magnetococcales bacterium]
MANLLLIDDDQDILDSLTMILEGNGHTVAIKRDTDNLLDAVKTIHPDLIILDIMLPEDSQAGFKAARLLAKDEETEKIPILILSAVNQRSNLSFTFSEFDINTEFMPVAAFIEKPVEPNVLLKRIDQLLFPS